MVSILEKYKMKVMDSFGKGLNTVFPSHKLPDGYLIKCQNATPDDEIGALKTVSGCVNAGTTAAGNNITLLLPFNMQDGTSVMLVSDNTTLWRTGDFVTFTSVKGSLGSSYQLRGAIVRDKVWFTNGNDSVFTVGNTYTVTSLDGSGATPTVPKGRYIDFWKERVWVADYASNRSILRFSSLVDTSGNDIAPDTANAWPAANDIAIGQDDGDVIYGLKVFAEHLFVFKKNSIWRLDGYDEYSFSPMITRATTGCMNQESIVELDNVLIFLGRDGIYKFDGSDTIRISDVIDPTVQDILQQTQRTGLKIWTTEADFDAGTLTQVDTPALPEVDLSYAAEVQGESSDTLGTLTETVSQSVTYAEKFNLATSHRVSAVEVYLVNILAGIATVALQTADGTTTYASGNTSALGAAGWYKVTFTTPVIVYGDLRVQVAAGGSGTFNWYRSSAYANGNAWNSSDGDTSYDMTFRLYYIDYNTTGNIVSDVYHVTDTISAWGSFEADYDSSITFQIRSGTSSALCQAASWNNISHGAMIAESTSNVYVQWKAAFTRQSPPLTPHLYSVTLNWFVGGTSKTIVKSIKWKERYLMAYASNGATYNDSILLIGRGTYGNPFYTMNGLNISSWGVFNDTLYAGTSDDDLILTMFTGTDFKGSAIDTDIQTGDYTSDVPTADMNVWEALIDLEHQTGYSFTFSYSIDRGVTWTDKTINLDGTGRFEKQVAINVNCKQIRFRFRSNTISQPITIYGLRMAYRELIGFRG